MCLLGMYFSETYTSVVVVNIIFPEQVMERSGARRSEVDEERRAERELAMERSGVTGYIDSCYIGKAKLYYCCIISSANCL